MFPKSPSLPYIYLKVKHSLSHEVYRHTHTHTQFSNHIHIHTYGSYILGIVVEYLGYVYDSLHMYIE